MVIRLINAEAVFQKPSELST